MSMTDPLGDMLTRIRNGQMARKVIVRTPASKLRANVLKVLEREGYIRGFTAEKSANDKPELEIQLKYFEGKPVISSLVRVSKPGCRMYSDFKDLPRAASGLGMYVLSTSRGVMSNHEARESRVGGELLCSVF